MTTEERPMNVCCFCGELIIGYGNNPDPLADGAKHRCCDDCNAEHVIPARMGVIADAIGSNPRAEGSWVMVLHERASDGKRPADTMYLATYDPNAYDGGGDATWTDNPDEAMRFSTPMDVLMFWRQQSTVRPIRDDGAPNKPLTAWTVEPRNLA